MTVLHTVRLAPVGGPMPSAGASGPLFEVRVHSPAGLWHGLLTGRPGPGRSGGAPALPFVDEHLALDLAGPDAARWRRHADVLHLGPTTLGDGPVPARLAAVLRAHPGCAVATADGRAGTLHVLSRTGGRLVLRPRPGSGGPPLAAQRLAVGSLAHAWLASGRALSGITGLAAPAHAGHSTPGGPGVCRGWCRAAR
ncbi:hypothetical protein ACFCX4_26605 [Kitasatospora sp. NPDC056327]|uniref:hypothetical protein n=1 Tax=Kitasatospora sp. NPDC056327 TaxID=3345785 RepID=UPI0035DDE2FD